MINTFLKRNLASDAIFFLAQSSIHHKARELFETQFVIINSSKRDHKKVIFGKIIIVF